MTATLTLLEVRCSRCWNSNCFSVETVGTDQECRNCGSNILVPEATPDRIARAEALLAEQPEIIEQPAASREQFDRQLSDREIQELVRKESQVPLEQMDFSGYPMASLFSRFLASTVDQFLMGGAFLLSFVMVMIMSKQGMAENIFETIRNQRSLSTNTLILLNCLPAMLAAIQWVLLSTSGQTIGKKLFMIRIVTTSGRLPGFVQAVVLRNWVRNLLYMIPLAWLVDCALALGESKRAGHDWLAGTMVVANV